MSLLLKLGGLPPQKLDALMRAAGLLNIPPEWGARVLINNGPYRPPDEVERGVQHTGSVTQRGGGGATRAHAGDLRLVSVEIGSDKPAHVRDATYTFHKLMERMVAAPNPQPRSRESYIRRKTRPSDDPAYRREKARRDKGSP